MRKLGSLFVIGVIGPTAATPETDPLDFGNLGKPHAMQGMAVEIDIT